ncbi:MAG: hypothetical protein M3Z36_08750 [Acidobacteriota bacterium]|nr:hypothetical protein [Acidobacteriota bacterium]
MSLSTHTAGATGEKVGTVVAEEINIQADHFESDAHRMRYPEFREQGFCFDSGVMEAGCVSIVGVRLKQPGLKTSWEDPRRLTNRPYRFYVAHPSP